MSRLTAVGLDTDGGGGKYCSLDSGRYYTTIKEINYTNRFGNGRTRAKSNLTAKIDIAENVQIVH